MTVGDDIERVRDFRNRVYGHADSTAIPDPVFQGYWNTVKDICTRMDGRYGGTVFTDKLKDIEKIDSVPKVIIDIVKEQIQRDKELKKELEGMKGNFSLKCINSTELIGYLIMITPPPPQTKFVGYIIGISLFVCPSVCPE